MNEDTLQVKSNDDGTFTLEWDPNDEKWSWLNTMTEDEISTIIKEYAQQVINDAEINSIITDDSLDPD